MIFNDSDRLTFKRLENNDEDRAHITDLMWNLSQFDKACQEKRFIEIYEKTYWDEINKHTTLNVMIYLRENGEFIGTVCMQHIDCDLPEIGIDILKKYQNKGYGTEAIAAFASWYCKNNSISKIKVRIDENNSHSIHVFEKLGAEHVGGNSYYSEKFIASLREKLSSDILQELTQDKIREYILRFPLKIK